MLTPRELMDLALSRHRQPWNFTVQTCGLCCLATALLLHNGLLTATALVLFGVGFLVLPLPPMPPGVWRRSIDRFIAAEVRWLNTPMSWQKLLKGGIWTLILITTIWALWVRELLLLTFLVAMWAVYRAYLYNKTTGIDA